MTANITFDSFFDTMITDNNNNACTDINKGIDKLYKNFNNIANDLYPLQNYLVAEFEEGYPELVAKNSILRSSEYWWWILLLNRLDNPFEDIKENCVYSINSTDQINNIIQTINESDTSGENSRIGTVIELN